MANEAGFGVRVAAAEFGAVIAATVRGDFQVTLGGWSGLLDPDSNTYAFLHMGSALNIATYSSAEADRALEAARAEADPSKGRVAYEALWRQEGANLLLIYLWTIRTIAGVSKTMAGVRLLANGLLPLQDVRPAP